MEDSQFIIIKENQYFKIEPSIIKYDNKSKRVKSSAESKTRRFIKSFYLSKNGEEKNIIFEIKDCKIHKLTPINEEEGTIDIILNDGEIIDDEIVRFFAKYDQYNVEQANNNKESWFKTADIDSININYLEEIYKPCLRIDSKGRIILRSSAYLRNYSPDFDIVNDNDEIIEFGEIINKRVEIIFENKGLIFNSKSFTPLFFINTIKLKTEDEESENLEEISFSRQELSQINKFEFNDEISLEKNNIDKTQRNGAQRNGAQRNEEINKEEISQKIKDEDDSVDSHLEEFISSLEKTELDEKEKWLKEIEIQDQVNKKLKDDIRDVGSESLSKKMDRKKSRDKKIRIVKKSKKEKKYFNKLE